MLSAEKKFQAYLVSKGLRFTSQRKIVFREIMSRHGHFEPEDLVPKLRKKGVSRTSIYRTLPLLIDAGIVSKTPCKAMAAHYEHIYGHEHHDHMVCTHCGRVVEFYDDSLEKLKARIAKKHGFKMNDHRLIISGLCDKCR